MAKSSLYWVVGPPVLWTKKISSSSSLHFFRVLKSVINCEINSVG